MASSRATARQRQSPLSDDATIAAQKRAAARAAAELIEDGMRVGLGTGSTVAHLLPAIAERALKGLRCVATSPATERAARALGLKLETLDEVGELDVAIDGADQIDASGWLIKGGGGAHTREKIVAVSARRFVVIASANKAVSELRPPVPLELVEFGVHDTLSRLDPARPRDVERSPDGGVIADYMGAVGDPGELAERLSATPGVVEHGLFAPELVSLILIAGDGLEVERRAGGKPGG
ncbi:MAG TPA: ribose-5-phosphate isomerase RpiA [Solirubrobacteraceae bacterium]|jgi:ribose 5-phosphate isomerase A|nr:ribose-5-phosphate isomerase RpiA [Solirubrobacteraceae bacterium]